jgi:uncharacterized Zn-binding protein involved in type VI secretion
MTRPVIRLGDPGSHGGTVTTGSPDTTANGIPVARVGDTLTSGSPDVMVN